MAKEKDTPSNEFKRVLTVAMKTIAEDPELSVAFGNEAPSLAGNRAKLPQVANELKAADIAIVRGLSDSFALRIANHNDKVHARYQPEGKNARAVFEAVEQARTLVETGSAQLESQRRQIELAAANVRSAQVQLDYCTIHAPFTGVVIAKAALNAMTVSAPVSIRARCMPQAGSWRAM